MKLKALTIGLALSFPMLASAQSTTNVTLYGLIDTGIEYVNNIGADKHNSVHMPSNTATLPSRWGLRGVEKISDNLSAIFTLESGFNPNVGTSNQGGRLFGRQAWVGLKGDWGQIAIGRQYNMLFWAGLDADILGPNIYGSGSIDSYIPNTRMDNSITYRGTFSGIKVGAAYARGRDTLSGNNPSATGCGVDYSDQSSCTAWSAMLGYDASTWGVNAAYDVMTGGNAGTFGGLTDPDLKDKRLYLNGYIKLDALKLGAGWIRRKNDGGVATPDGDMKRSDIWYLQAAYAFTPAFTLDGGVFYNRYKNADNKSILYAARGTYSLSKRTAVYLTAGFMNNKGQANTAVSGGTPGTNPMAGVNQTGAMVGMRHSF